MNDTKRVLVYGATGSQASPLVGALLARGHRPVVVTRDVDKASAHAAVGAEIVEGDMSDPARLAEISANVDAVMLLIPFALANPADGLTYGRNAIDAARAAGVRHIIWNASGPVPFDTPMLPPGDPRQQVLDQLRASDIPYTVFTPTIYAENLLGPWTAPAVAAGNEVPYATPPAMQVAWIASADLAALMVAELDARAHLGEIVAVSGIEALDGPALAAAFSAALGRPFSYRGLQPAEFGAILDRVFGPGAGAGAAAVYGPLWEMPAPPPLAVDMQPVLARLPVQMQTVQHWIAAHAGAFGG